ncbi:MAG: hypothetical protein IH630_02225 [Thermoplasmata archaeon]|nr:hypothetical protein [Thermoplasmata archaeon]
MSITIDDQTDLPDHVISYGPIEITVLEDDVPPVTEIQIIGTLGVHEWYTSEVTVTFFATDIGSSMISTQWSLNSGAWTEYAGVFEMAYEGINNITYRSIDANDNVEANRSTMLKIDTETPIVSIDMDTTATSSSVEVDIFWADATSGVARMVASLDDGEWNSSFLMETISLEDLEDGEHTLTVTVYDTAGNSASDTVTFSVETSLFAMDGPAGPWVVIGLITGIAAAIGAAGYLFVRKMKTK